MSWTRKVVSVLLAVVIVVAPMSAAWAGDGPRSTAPETHGPGHAAVHETDAAGAMPEAMEDCAGMMGAAGDADCPHCAKDKACSPDVCLAKCFQILGVAPQPGVALILTGVRFRPAEIARPPDWSWRPQPPPPRA